MQSRSFTMRSSSTLVLREFEPHLAIALRVVTPALAHLHEQEQVHRLLDRLRDLTPGIGTDRLDGLAALAEHDLALALALHIDRLLDADRAALALLPLLRLDGGLVGQFLVQTQIKLLARDLGRKLAQRGVGDLVLGVMPGSRRPRRGEPALEVRDPVAG